VAEMRAELRDLRHRHECLERISDIYISPDVRIFDVACPDRALIEEAACRKTAASKEYGMRISSLEDRVEDLEGRLLPDEPQRAQKDRGEVLRALLLAHGGKMLRSEARKKMRISESRFSELLSVSGSFVAVRPYKLNKSQKLLVLKTSAEVGSLP